MFDKNSDHILKDFLLCFYMNKINYPIYNISQGFGGNDVYISGGNGKKGLNGLVHIRINKDARELLKTIEFPDVVSAVTTSHKGPTYIAVAVGSEIKLFDQKFIELTNHNTNSQNTLFQSLEFSHDSRSLLCVDPDNKLSLFSIPSLSLLSSYPIETPEQVLSKATFLKDTPNNVIAFINKKYFKLFEMSNETMKEIANYPNIFNFDPLGIFSHDDTIVVVGVNNDVQQSAILELKLIDNVITTSRIVHPVPDLISSVVQSKNTLALGTTTGDAFILNINSLGRQRVARKISKHKISALCPCGKYIVVGNEDGSIAYLPNHARFEQFFFLLIFVVCTLIFSISMIIYINT